MLREKVSRKKSWTKEDKKRSVLKIGNDKILSCDFRGDRVQQHVLNLVKFEENWINKMKKRKS